MNKKIIGLSSIVALSLLSTSLTSVYAANTTSTDSLNLDSIMSSLGTSNSTTNSNTTDTAKPVTTTTTKTIEVTKTSDNNYDVKNWNADYLLEFVPQKNTKITENTIKILTPSDWKIVQFLYEGEIKTYKVWDTLKKWQTYYVDLSADYNELAIKKDPIITFSRVIKKTNGTIDTLNAETVYTFTNKTIAKPVVKTEIIKAKHTWFYENMLFAAFLVMFLSLFLIKKAE